MRYITLDDFIDVYSKVVQRGADLFFSKLTFNKKARTRSAFSDSFTQSSNWWIIPTVRKRWNKMITGDAEVNYKKHFVKTYLEGKQGLKLLSLGAGTCTHEIELAGYPQFSEIVCVDLAENRLKQAEKEAKIKGLSNIKFVATDLNTFDFNEAYYDIVLFNASLHHFENVAGLLENNVKKTLKEGGLLVINEYVGPNRLQYPKGQIKAINKGLKLIDPKYRKRYKTNFLKNHYYGSGVWRMVMADPSECVDSAVILPEIHKNFRVLEEKGYGGNILMSVLKDIAHHFVELDPKKEEILQQLFAFEDEYLESHTSDFVFGVYKKE